MAWRTPFGGWTAPSPWSVAIDNSTLGLSDNLYNTITCTTPKPAGAQYGMAWRSTDNGTTIWGQPFRIDDCTGGFIDGSWAGGTTNPTPPEYNLPQDSLVYPPVARANMLSATVVSSTATTMVLSTPSLQSGPVTIRHNDRPAIQAALDYASTQPAYANSVYLPPGFYNLDQELEVWHYTNFFGAGSGASELFAWTEVLDSTSTPGGAMVRQRASCASPPCFPPNSGGQLSGSTHDISIEGNYTAHDGIVYGHVDHLDSYGLVVGEIAGGYGARFDGTQNTTITGLNMSNVSNAIGCFPTDTIDDATGVSAFNVWMFGSQLNSVSGYYLNLAGANVRGDNGIMQLLARPRR